jgi:hypothetical protein
LAEQKVDYSVVLITPIAKKRAGLGLALFVVGIRAEILTDFPILLTDFTL